MNALFIGRFQPFHNGHLAVLKEFTDTFSLKYIGIGSSQYGYTSDNPFTFEERKTMIQLVTVSFQELARIQVIPIPDIHDPPRWVDHVNSIISNVDTIISNNPLTIALFTEKGYSIKTTKLFNRKTYSGKEIRRRMIVDEPWGHLVPKLVEKYLNEIDAVARIKELHKQYHQHFP